MTRFIAILLLGLVLEALGVTFLSKGLKTIGGLEKMTSGALGAWLTRALTNPSFVAGVLCETLFFAILLYLLAQRDVSLVWPLTALGFALTALAARFFLGEQVSPMRWAGVILIVVGAMLVSYSERVKGTRDSGASLSNESTVSTRE